VTDDARIEQWERMASEWTLHEEANIYDMLGVIQRQREEIAAERADHAVTRRALELACSDVHDKYPHHSMSHLIPHYLTGAEQMIEQGLPFWWDVAKAAEQMKEAQGVNAAIDNAKTVLDAAAVKPKNGVYAYFPHWGDAT